MTFNVGDEVVANTLPPVMTISEIVGKKAICQWTEKDSTHTKKYFLTELKPASELENIKAEKKEKRKAQAKKKVLFRAKHNKRIL